MCVCVCVRARATNSVTSGNASASSTHHVKHSSTNETLVHPLYSFVQLHESGFNFNVLLITMHALPKMEYKEIRLLSKVELFLDSF